MSDRVQQWEDQARYDLETARAMLSAGRYLYVPFCCQQAIEKMFKARIIKLTGELAPRIHNLIKLTELAKLTVTAERLEVLDALSNLYAESRYPKELEEEMGGVDEDFARLILSQTEEVMQWLTLTP
jgi:HEPN domain-containing protein